MSAFHLHKKELNSFCRILYFMEGVKGLNNEFILTSRPDNIFYGDIFRVNDKGCLVMGSGKTKAFRKSIQNDNDKIALDFACITSDENNIYGHFEMEFRSVKVEDPISKRIKLDYFVRMLNEQETKYIFNGRKDIIKEISMVEFINISEFNITYKIGPDMIPRKDLTKKDYFKRIVGNKKVICVLSPWCDSIEEKSELIIKYIK